MPTTRFAPSPTGLLHLGHVQAALFACRLAGPGGRFLLRIEDIDPVRCRPEYAAAIEADLAWVGLDWPRPARRQSEHLGEYRAVLDDLRERDLLYPCFCTRAAIASALVSRAIHPVRHAAPDTVPVSGQFCPAGRDGLGQNCPAGPDSLAPLHPAAHDGPAGSSGTGPDGPDVPGGAAPDVSDARCSVAHDGSAPSLVTRDVASALRRPGQDDLALAPADDLACFPDAPADALHAPHGAEPVYPGTCRGLDPGERRERLARGDPHAWRLDMAAALRTLPRPLERTELGPGGAWDRLACDPGRFGDVVLGRRDVPASYHLCVTHDDALQGVTLVTRAEDLRPASDLHRLLQALLGWPEPAYAHHPLLLDARGRRLSKRDGAPTIAALRAQGATPEAVRAMGAGR